MRTEFKNQDGFVFTPECAHWFASNYLPTSRDSSRGFTRRWLVLDFNHPVPEEQRIEGLAEAIVAEEREAIAAWAVEGLRRVLDQRGFTEPACHHQRIAEMRRANNSVHAFLDDSDGVMRGDGEMLLKDVYHEYTNHMRNDSGGNRPVSFERFRGMLEELDLKLVRRIDPIGSEIVSVAGVKKRERRLAA